MKKKNKFYNNYVIGYKSILFNIFQFTSIYFTVSQRISIYFNVSQRISMYLKVFQRISMYLRVFPRISTYFEVFPNIYGCLKVFLFISIYFQLFQNTPIYSQRDSLSQYLKIAAENNPALKAKYAKYLADLQKVPQVSSLPDPDISFGYFIQPMELIGGKQQAQIQFMQMFPWFGTLKSAKDEASAMALSSFELFRAEKEEIFYSVLKSYYQLFLNEKQIQVYDTTFVLLKSIEQLLFTKLKTVNIGSTNPVNSGNQQTNNNSRQGSSSMGMNSNNQPSGQQGSASMNNPSMTGNSTAFADLLRLQVEIKELEDNIASIKNRKQMLMIQINTLLNRNSVNEFVFPDSLKTPLFDFYNPALFDSIKTNNPMLKMNKADILAYKKRREMNKKMGYPMVGLGLNYSLINKSEMSTSEMNGKDMVMPMLTVKLPIYRKKYNAAIKEAQYLESSANEQLKSTENMLYMSYSEYLFALKDAERKLSLYHDIISLTQKSFDLLLVQYTSSGADFDAIIRLHRQLLDYKLNITQTKVDKLSAMAGLQKLLSKN
jgi:outer membrane protein TolC